MGTDSHCSQTSTPDQFSLMYDKGTNFLSLKTLRPGVRINGGHQ